MSNIPLSLKEEGSIYVSQWNLIKQMWKKHIHYRRTIRFHSLSRWFQISTYNSANIYLFKVNNRNTRKRHEISSKLTIRKPEQRQWRLLIFLLLTLNIFTTFSSVSIIDFEQVNVSWIITNFIIKVYMRTSRGVLETLLNIYGGA